MAVLLMGIEILSLELCYSLMEAGALTKSLACSHSAPQAGKTIVTQYGFVACALSCSSICFLLKKQAWALGRDQINKSGPAAKALGVFILH